MKYLILTFLAAVAALGPWVLLVWLWHRGSSFIAAAYTLLLILLIAFFHPVWVDYFANAVVFQEEMVGPAAEIARRLGQSGFDFTAGTHRGRVWYTISGVGETGAVLTFYLDGDEVPDDDYHQTIHEQKGRALVLGGPDLDDPETRADVAKITNQINDIALL